MSRSERAVRAFARRAQRRRPALLELLQETAADRALDRAEREYEALVPELLETPKGLLNGALGGTYELLAYARALEAEGLDPEQIGRFYDRSYRLLAGRFPKWLGRAVFRWARPLLVRRLRRDALRDDGWDVEVLDRGRGVVAFDVRSCPVCELFERHGQSSVVPWVCALDDTMSERFGLGLQRTGTRALGASRCDFRYRPGEATRPLRTLPVLDDGDPGQRR